MKISTAIADRLRAAINRQRLVDTAVRLIEVPSRTGEAGAALDCLARMLTEDGFTVEIGPNGFLDTKPTTVELCRDLGLGDRLVAASEAASKNRYLFLGNKLRKLPGGRALSESAGEVTDALAVLEGKTLEQVKVQSTGPGSFLVTLGVEGLELSVRLDRAGARIHSVGV